MILCEEPTPHDKTSDFLQNVKKPQNLAIERQWQYKPHEVTKT